MRNPPFTEEIGQRGPEHTAKDIPSATPTSAKQVGNTGGYGIYVDSRTHLAYVDTKDYHPGTLIIQPDGLARLVRRAFPKPTERAKFLSDLLPKSP